jgi:hypothetical protein
MCAQRAAAQDSEVELELAGAAAAIGQRRS